MFLVDSEDPFVLVRLEDQTGLVDSRTTDFADFEVRFDLAGFEFQFDLAGFE